MVSFNIAYAVFCIKCGTKNADDANFCIKCGTKIAGLDDESNKTKSDDSAHVSDTPKDKSEKAENKSNVQSEGNAGKSEVTEVVVNGLGADADSALKNAFSNAIEQAIGLVVDAETCAKNEGIVKDQILTYTDAYIEKYDKINEGKRDDELFEVKIKAHVKKKDLLEKLKQTNISIKKIDAKNIFGDLFAKDEGYQKAAIEFENFFEGIPDSLIDVDLLDPKPTIKVVNNSDIVEASWKIKISYNREKYYKNFEPTLEKFLENNAISKGGKTVFLQSKENYEKYLIGREAYYVVKWNALRLGPPDAKSQILLSLNVSRNKIGDNLGWKDYVLDKQSYEKVLTKILCRKLKLRISFLDSNNNLIKENDFGIDQNSKVNKGNVIIGNLNDYRIVFPIFVSNNWKRKPSYDDSNIAFSIAPFFSIDGGGSLIESFFDAITLETTLKFKMNEVKEISKIKVGLVEE